MRATTLPPEARRLLGVVPDGMIADRFGLGRRAVRAARLRAGVNPCGIAEKVYARVLRLLLLRTTAVDEAVNALGVDQRAARRLLARVVVFDRRLDAWRVVA
jgi:hypothetical protein